jgi:carbonic anhydrase
MNQSLLQQLKEANRMYLSGSPRFLDSSGDPFVVITCMDARLTGLLESALGLPKGRAIVIRTAGNVISGAARDVLRSVAAAIFIKGASEVFVAGHSDCALAKFSAGDVIEAFRKAGIPRSAFGAEDLREWFGAFTDVKANVLQGVQHLRASGLVPDKVKVHGLVVGIETGELEVVLDGDAVRSATAPVGHEEEPPAPTTRAAPPPAPPKVTKGPVVIAPTEKPSRPVRQPESMLDAVMIVRDFIAREKQSAHFDRTIAQIETLARSERDPVRVVTDLETIANDYRTQYPELPGAIAYLKKIVHDKGPARLGLKELMKRMLE